jgi:hypothetical protein
MARVFAIPAEGMRVRKPDGSVLNPAGEPVERDSFWLRRQRDGDVTLSALPQTAAVDTPAAVAVTDASVAVEETAKTTRKGA